MVHRGSVVEQRRKRVEQQVNEGARLWAKGEDKLVSEHVMSTWSCAGCSGSGYRVGRQQAGGLQRKH